MAEMDFVEVIKERYPHISDTKVKAIVDKAKMFYYSLRYPSLPLIDEETKPINDFIGQQFVLGACDEQIQRFGFGSMKTYRENGITMEFECAELSETLRRMITPIAGVIS